MINLLFMTPSEKKYWKIRAALELLMGIEDKDVERCQEAKDFLNTSAQIILAFQEKGVEKMIEESRTTKLKAMGVAVLKPKK